ncbi:MAG: Na+/H+ antiporter subunit E [Puniceicoccaceae bacterium]
MKRIFGIARFFLFYVKEVVIANLQIAGQILRPGRGGPTPRFLAVSIEGLNDRQLLIVTNLITMTPGTLSFDVSPDRRTVLIHQLIPAAPPEAARRSLESDYVERVREIF